MVKTADVKQNRFSVIYTSRALLQETNSNALGESSRATTNAPAIAPLIDCLPEDIQANVGASVESADMMARSSLAKPIQANPAREAPQQPA